MERKRYTVTKIVFAKDLQELLSLEKGGELIDIHLEDEIRLVEDIGFHKENGNRKRHKMV